MHFLSLESSTHVFALAVSKDAKVVRFRNAKVNKVLENSIVPSIDRILEAAEVPFKKLDGFAVGLGPGSFTSLRIGLATVKAFALATGKPVVGVPSFDVIAEGAKDLDGDEICVIADARRNLVYSGLYKKNGTQLQLQGSYALSSLEAVLDRVHGRTIFVGDALKLFRNHIEAAYKQHGGNCTAVFAPEKLWFPQAKHLAKLAYARFVRGDTDEAARLQPVYLYASDCQVSQS